MTKSVKQLIKEARERLQKRVTELRMGRERCRKSKSRSPSPRYDRVHHEFHGWLDENAFENLPPLIEVDPPPPKRG